MDVQKPVMCWERKEYQYTESMTNIILLTHLLAISQHVNYERK